MKNEYTNCLMDIYDRLPVSFEHGQGMWLWDTQGERYLDALSGFAVCGLGHSHSMVTEAIVNQTRKLIHTSNAYQIPNQIALAQTLCRLSKLSRAVFCNSGSEAVEIALKLIHLYGNQRGIKSPHVVVMEDAYHGRTLATLSASGSSQAKEGFEPLIPRFIRIPFNDIKSLERVSEEHKNITAVLLEPIQGAGGIKIPSEDYLVKVRNLCDKNGWLLALDEVQTGLGRTGSLFAYQTSKILPDILILAKALGNGVPIGACLAHEKIAVLFSHGKYNSTFGGNPLSTAASLATIKEIEKHELWKNANIQGERLLNGLKRTLRFNPLVKEVRGQGLMIGIELIKPYQEVVLSALEKKLLIGISNKNTIRLLPALIINENEVDQIIDIISGLL
jgi:acetylornithine/N-succinyldiaminopimelate aminotransferase